jgi:hypothetical protein
MASKGQQIVDYMKRVAAEGQLMGFAANETAAIGSAMIAAGAEADVAATSFRNMGKALAVGAGATARQRKAYALLGLDAAKVSKQFQENSVDTIAAVFERIRALPKDRQISTITNLFGSEARAIGPLLANIKLFEDALERIKDDAVATSLEDEYSARIKTFDSRLQTFTNSIESLGIVIGNALIPHLTSIMNMAVPLIAKITELAEAHPELTAAIAGTTAGLVALNVAAIATRWSFFFLKGGVLSAAVGIGRAGGMIGAAVKKVRVLAFAGAMLGSVSGSGTVFGILSGAAAASVGVIKAAAAGIAAALGTISLPLVAIVAGIAAVGVAVYKYWVPIREIALGIGEVFGEALGGMQSSLISFAGMLGIEEQAIRSAFAGIGNAVSDLFSGAGEWISAAASSISEAFAGFFKMEQYSAQAEGEFRDLGRRIGQMIVDGISSALDLVIGKFVELPKRILAAIGKIDLSSVISMPSFNFGWGETAKKTVDGARASGGPVSAGSTYLVGERGPEMITPTRSGHVHSARDTGRILSGSGGGSSVTVTIGDIIVQEASNAQEIALQLGDAVKSQLAGLQADLEFTVG